VIPAASPAPSPSPAPPGETEVLEALRPVLDPELDRSIVDLGFVRVVGVVGGEVRVQLRLPTYWCAPNFSWLMAADVRRALLALPGVERAHVALLDHHAGQTITEGVNAERSFGEAFGEPGDGGLDELRRSLRRKAFCARQERVLALLPRRGRAGLRRGDLPPAPETDAYLAIRAELGLPCSPDAPALTDADGREVDDVDVHRRRSRITRISLESNSVLCEAVLAAHPGVTDEREECR